MGALLCKKMNSDVYKLRRRVIDLIYEIKELVDLPRVEVRITDNHESILGQGTKGQFRGRSWIWISERAIKASEFDLRTIVYHEVLHPESIKLTADNWADWLEVHREENK